MKKLMVTCLAGLVLGTACPSAYGFDAGVVMYVDSAEHADALVSAEEFSETWSGPMMGSFMGNWSFTSRQGFRITGHAPGTGVPDLTGFGFSYGDVQLDVFADQYNGQYAVVEDPRPEFDGSFGRIWGHGPDEKRFEGTIKFHETGSSMNGEINIVFLGGQEVYMQNTSFIGLRKSRAFVEYSSEAPIGIGYDMTLSGETVGFFFSSSDLTVDMTSLILQDFTWQHVACDDVLMFGEMSLPEPFAQSDFWIQSYWDAEDGLNYGNGMLATSCSLAPETTIYAVFDEPYTVGGGLVEHAVSSDLIPGDANLDGTVNDMDASILAAHWQQQSEAAWCDGDFDGDGKVTDTDASILAAHWQGSAGEDNAPVPEPAPVVLLLGTLLLLRKKGAPQKGVRTVFCRATVACGKKGSELFFAGLRQRSPLPAWKK